MLHAAWVHEALEIWEQQLYSTWTVHSLFNARRIYSQCHEFVIHSCINTDLLLHAVIHDEVAHAAPWCCMLGDTIHADQTRALYA